MYNTEDPNNAGAEACVNMYVGGSEGGALPVCKELLDQSVADKM